MPTTEIATIPITAGAQIGEPSDPAAAVLKDVTGIIAQQDGFQSQVFGMELENPDTLQMAIDWDSKKKHEEFMAADSYGPFVERFKTIIAAPYNLCHVDFTPEGGAKKAFSAPVTEVATFYYDGEPPSDTVEKALEFLEKCEKSNPKQKIYGYAYGVTHEVIEREGVKGKGAVLVIGWDSKEEHMAFRENQVFTDNIHLLRQTCQKLEVHHTSFLNHAE